MVKRKVGALEKIEADLSNLQHKIHRDAESYKHDFQNQYSQYESLMSLYLQDPGTIDENGLVSLRDQIDFIAHVADRYPSVTATFPGQLEELLSKHHRDLEMELREKVVVSLVLLRNRDVIDSTQLLSTLFPILVSTSSKSLRALLYQKILSDLRSANSKTTNHRLNRTIQAVLHNLITSDRTSSKGLWAVKITRELWKRQIWADSKAVEIMKEAALAENEKVIAGGVRFFLGGDKEREEAAEDTSDDDDAIDMAKLRHQAGINKKGKKEKELKRAAAVVKRKERKKKAPHPLNFSALHLLNDPQGFAESLFSRHLQNSKSKLGLEQKLLVLQLVSRLVGLHKLTVISLYSYFIKYLSPRQASVTSFLASLAQATHSLVPPDVIEPLVHKIANEFVSEAAASEVASAGLNAIREICVRQPLAIDDTLLQDLVEYRKSKDKGVMMAAKGLLSLYREVAPDMLRRRDRGKEAALGLRDGTRGAATAGRRFGEEAPGQIEGIELLEAWKEEERRRQRAEEGLSSGAEEDAGAEEARREREEAEGWRNWDVEEDDSDDSGGWIDVPADGEEAFEISDSEDEKNDKKKKRDSKQGETEPPAKKVKFADDISAPAAGEDAPPGDAEPTAIPASTEKKPSALASTRILTPADLAKLAELRTSAAITAQLPSSHRKHHAASTATATSTTAATPSHTRHADDPLLASHIEGLASLSAPKRTRDEKIAMARAHRAEDGAEPTGRHRSAAAVRKEKKRAEGKSSTNREKERAKNFLMTLGKARGKGRRSLVEVRKAVRGHAQRQKRGGRRGNR